MTPRIFSGQRPTGLLHIGHLIGTLQSWVRLQETHECFFGIVDWHMLTTNYEDTAHLGEHIQEMAATWLACGIDPERSTILLQSQVKQHAELALILGIGCLREDAGVRRYALPLALVGGAVALWHSLLYFGAVPQAIEPCGQGPSCTGIDMTILGGLPLPMLSLGAFAAVVLLLTFTKPE